MAGRPVSLRKEWFLPGRAFPLSLVLLMGCATANWRWFDAGVTPPQDVKWAVLGAGFDAGLQVAKVPFVWRVVADGSAAGLVRMTHLFGKHLDSGFMLVFGASGAEVLGAFRKILR